MNVNEITPLFGTDFSNDGLKQTTEVTESGAAFIDIFTSAIDNVRQTDKEKNQLEYLLAVGELDNPAQLTIAATKAQTAVELLVQLRTKALDVHSQLMNMGI